MKKLLELIAMMLSLALFLTACGSNEANRISGEVENLSQHASVNAAGDAAAGAGSNGGAKTADTGSGGNAYKGYTFTHAGAVIAIDANFAPVLSALGEPKSYFEVPSCAFEGLDKIYTYNGFEIDTYPRPDGDFVSAIVLKDDTVATAEGIFVGSSRAEMEAAYGPGHENDSGQIVYQKDEMRLCFILDGESVTAIEYQTLALDE